MNIFAIAILLSAFLLFQVQPIIARYILAWFGGSPAVWTTCMLFFQVGLLIGYSYAHLIAKRLPLKQQAIVHAILVALALITLPITPDHSQVSLSGEEPFWQVLFLLMSSVGLPFVLLSATAPLLQHWYAFANPGKSPFPLYALSNFGSLVALLSYPFLIEPYLGLKMQTWSWSVGYAIFMIALLCSGYTVLKLLGYADLNSDRQQNKSTTATTSEWQRVKLSDRLLWILLPALGSVMLLAATNQMTQDVAVVPFLWVLPLSLYLLTFIICFDHDRWYVRKLWTPLFIVAVTALLYLLHSDYAETEMALSLQITIYMSALFATCMLCHGELVRLKPTPKHLTDFYLSVSLGGALGGILVNLVAPNLFDGYWELHIGLVAVAVVAGLLTIFALYQHLSFYRKSLTAITSLCWLIGVAALTHSLIDHAKYQQEDSIENVRNFYGLLHIYEYNRGEVTHKRSLHHGRISHGEQWFSTKLKRRPTNYYGYESGVGVAFRRHPNRYAASGGRTLNVGVVGLGVGTLAAYGKYNDTFRFYEINDEVERIAREHFTYLEDTRSKVEIILGDGRISLERELNESGSHQFDLLVVDAFSGDAIPIHLLTEEAAAIYAAHLKEDGILAIHISNLHVDLRGVVAHLAEHIGKKALFVERSPDNLHENANDWVLITNNPKFLDDNYVIERAELWSDESNTVQWSDDFSNLFEVVDW